MTQWIIKTLIPCITVALITSIIGIGCVKIMPSSFLRLVCVCALTLGTTLMVSWVFAIDANERIFFKSSIKRGFEKLTVMRFVQ